MAISSLTLFLNLARFSLALAIATSLTGSAEARKLHYTHIPSIQVFNLLSIQGNGSTTGFNALRCGGPAQPQPFMFGTIFCFDMPLLKKKDLNSELLGRVQGTFTIAQQTGGAVFVTETFILNGTSLRFKGTFSAVGLENIGRVSRKPITGGTDDFTLATGVAVTTPLGGGTLDSHGNAFFWFKYKFNFE